MHYKNKLFPGEALNKMQRQCQKEQTRRQQGIGVLKVDGAMAGKKKATSTTKSPGGGSFLQPRDDRDKGELLAQFQLTILTNEYIHAKNMTNNHIF